MIRVTSPASTMVCKWERDSNYAKAKSGSFDGEPWDPQSLMKFDQYEEDHEDEKNVQKGEQIVN